MSGEKISSLRRLVLTAYSEHILGPRRRPNTTWQPECYPRFCYPSSQGAYASNTNTQALSDCAFTGLDCRTDSLGCSCFLLTSLDTLPLYTHLPHQILPHHLLYRAWIQFCLLRFHSLGLLFDLPPAERQLGPSHWGVWRSEITGSIHRHLQSDYGCVCGHSANASTLAITNEHRKEAGSKRYFRHGCSVSDSFPGGAIIELTYPLAASAL